MEVVELLSTSFDAKLRLPTGQMKKTMETVLGAYKETQWHLIILIVNDIYPGSSTHPKVVFGEVLHQIKLEFGNVDF